MAIIRNLVAHEKLVLDVIKRQAGTFEKALLEAIMNGFEAGSPKVAIEFSVEDGKAKAIITDTGKGFRSETEIHEWFEKFGTPHTEEENKKWAQFRMGRGQGFAFGRNVWRSGEFRMVVDINKMGLQYELEQGLEHFPGCRIEIELYVNPIGQYYASIDTLKSAIKHQIEFMEGVILFNGEQINTPASGLDWDIETEDAYYMFGKGQDLAIYNMGAFVMTRSASQMGVTGVVVSKPMLLVNFARNDILQSCPIYARIMKVVRDNRVKKIRKARRDLDCNERSSVLTDLRDGLIDYDEVRMLGLIEMTNGSRISLDKMRLLRQHWSVGEPGEQRADRMIYLDQAVFISRDVLDSLDYPREFPERGFFSWLLRESAPNLDWTAMQKMYRPFEELVSGFSTVNKILPRDKWTRSEKMIIRALESYNCWDGRALTMGLSDSALAWTDGQSYIALARSYLQQHRPSAVYGASHVLMIMFHELAHDDSTDGTHHHSTEYYRRFHNIMVGSSEYRCLGWMMADLPNRLKNLKDEDWHERAKIKADKATAARNKRLGLDKPRITDEAAEVVEEVEVDDEIVTEVLEEELVPSTLRTLKRRRRRKV